MAEAASLGPRATSLRGSHSVKRGRFRRLLASSLAALIMLLGVPRIVERLLLALSTVGASSQTKLTEASHSITYVLPTESWHVLHLPAGHGAIKLVTNA